MNLLATLENGLFAIGQVLRLPVMVLLWLCLLTTFIVVGRSLVDLLMRRRERSDFDLDRWLASHDSPLDGDAELPSDLRRFLARARAGEAAELLDEGGLEHLLLQHEERDHNDLRWPRVIVRVGPSLGLLGTLIPMGSSLAAMASGNLEAMAGQMVVAFTTTIIGLACGTAAYVVQIVRQHWMRQDLRERRFLAEKVAGALEAGRAT